MQTLNRVASARTMDGYKIRAKLALNFPRAVGNAEAEDTMMQYARAYAAAVECELSNGDLPFEEHELLARITDQVTILPKKCVRLIGLHVWHKGAISSGSMLAVKPPEGKPTVPAMAAVSQTRQRAESAPTIHSAATIKPPDAIPSEARSGALTAPAPAPASRPRRNSMPAERVSTPAATVRTAPASQRAPVVSRPSPSMQSPATSVAAARVASGVVPAVEPRIVRTKSGFSIALEQCRAETGDAVGKAIAQPVRDAAAGVLLSTLDALHASLTDPLGLLDGRLDAEVRRSLIGEACVCVCYVLYEALQRTSLPQMLSIEVVQGACVHALMDKSMPVSEISRYLATESPREEFSARACTLLGVRENTEMQQRVESALRALRIDVKTCAEQIERQLSRGRTAAG